MSFVEAPPFGNQSALACDQSAQTSCGNPGLREWAINGDFLAFSSGGVQRYGREVTRALDSLIACRHPLTRNLKVTLIVPAPTAELDLTDIAVKIVPEFRRPRLPQVWCQLQLPRHVRGGLLSFCNLAPVVLRRQIVCIHDLQTRLQPESYSFGFRLAHRIILPALGWRSLAVTTVSEQSRDDLVKYGVATRGKVHVTWNGADHAGRWRPERSRMLHRRPFVFGFARPQAHKNMALFWKLAPALEASGVDIVLSGQLSQAELAVLGPLPANVNLVGRLGDDDIAAALQGAIAFLIPSRAEGFGLPMVEAMIWSCPVLASDIPSLRSVGLEGALYFDPDDTAGWAAGVLAMKCDVVRRQRLLEVAQQRVENFSWRRIGERYLELMAAADGRGERSV